MERLFAEQLKKLFDSEGKQPSSHALGLIHTASQARILSFAEEYAKPGLSGLNDIKESCPDEPEIPATKAFEMGEFVKLIQHLPETLKSISKRTTGWNPKYARIRDAVGFVTSVCNEHDCHIQVFFPEIPLSAELYAGVLESTNQKPKLNTIARFSINDVVIIKAPKGLMALLQDGLQPIPEYFLNQNGRVVGVDDVTVHVTFEGTFSYRVNPALLQIGTSEDRLRFDPHPNSKGITKGDRVKVKKNLKKLIKSQNDTGRWESWKSRLPGMVVRVVSLKKNDLLRVCVDNGLSFDLHTERVMKLEGSDEENDDDTDDVAYALDEWVKLKNTPNMMEVLNAKNIPITILEYLEYPATITSYKHDSNPTISFDFAYSIHVDSNVLERLDAGEKKSAQELDGRQKQWIKGDKVYLNLGPPNYVRDVLKEQNIAENVTQALTSSAVLLGFTDSQHAVIECCDGLVRVVEKIFLAYPEKFSGSREDKIGRVLGDLLSIVEECLDECHQRLSLPQQGKHLDRHLLGQV